MACRPAAPILSMDHWCGRYQSTLGSRRRVVGGVHPATAIFTDAGPASFCALSFFIFINERLDGKEGVIVRKQCGKNQRM